MKIEKEIKNNKKEIETLKKVLLITDIITAVMVIINII